MTKNEFDRWWSDLTLRFPSVEAWLLRHHDTESSQRALLKTWLEVLADTDVSFALEVTSRMHSGDLEWQFENYGFEERLPQHVRKLAKQLAWERSGEAVPQRDLGRLGKGGSGFPAKAILARWHELQSQGVPRAKARDQALAEFPVGESRWRDPRYNCPACLDTGRVHVASNAAIKAMLAGEFSQCHHRDAVERCNCPTGARLVRKCQGRDLAWVTFDLTLDFAVRDPLWRQDEQDRFAAWCYEQQDRRAEAFAKSAANYEPAFTKFNQREAFR